MRFLQDSPLRLFAGRESNRMDHWMSHARGRLTLAVAAVVGLAGSAAAEQPAAGRGLLRGLQDNAETPRPAQPSTTLAVAPAAAPATPPAAAAPKAPVAAPKPDVWSPQEIADAKAQCAVLLKGLDAVVIPEDPIKQGSCGTPAPVQLLSIGKNPQVALSPPPQLTCEMVATLGKWLKEDVQPLARKHLGAPIARIDVMSSYSCRAAYGRVHNRLSEHAHANALDIRGFIATNAAEAIVLADWGPTAREIAIQVAAAKAAAQKLAAEKAAAEAAAKAVAAAKPAPQPPSTPAAPAVAAAPAPAATAPSAVASTVGRLPGVGTLIEGVPGLRLPGARPAEGTSAFGFASPNKLGGPKAAPAAAAAPMVSGDSKLHFLREVHTSACRLFGTVLGPEANNAHRNHFHIDMAERKTKNFCE